ncbi:MAG: hypothetical protein J6T80_02185 [Paludibacteraceae bacterium]|nr:hypothetical protein [Paludibacteraceae bacterium]
MKKDAITLATLCARLERAIHADVGMQGLSILLYGWITKYGRVTRDVLRARKREDGEAWLDRTEAELFSNYAGYDLTVN